jgi:hypothetical protein
MECFQNAKSILLNLCAALIEETKPPTGVDRSQGSFSKISCPQTQDKKIVIDALDSLW